MSLILKKCFLIKEKITFKGSHAQDLLACAILSLSIFKVI